MSAETTRVIPIERHEFVSARPFDDVLASVNAGLGHPDFGRLQRDLASITDWTEYTAAVAREAGASGLMVFLALDLGDVIARDPSAQPYRVVRIIAGNPVTMESMVRSTPQAGAFAPVTILIFDRPDGVHLRYDTLVSGVGDELQDDAREHAEQLDRSVLSLLSSAV